MNIKELYAYREMIISLVRKDLRGRYKGSVLGFMWTFINPLLQLLVYTLVFSEIIKMGIDKFYLFIFIGLVPWIFFSSSITGGATIVLQQQDLIKKIYFPRLVLPVAYITSSFINMIFSFVVIFVVILCSKVGFNVNALLLLPIIMVCEYILSLGIALIASAITVYLRDLEHILNIISLAWMYLTPIVYPIEMVPDKYKLMFNINPMVPIITAYRDILFYKRIPNMTTISHAFILGILILIFGCLIFSKLQKNFAEEL